jgi:Fe-S protein assembly chaperone HscA
MTHPTNSPSTDPTTADSTAGQLILGIDLGTTNSLCAVMTPSGPRVLTDAQGRKLLPSVVTFLPDGNELVGHEARALALIHPERTVASIKRLMGRSGAEVDAEAERLAYAVVHGERGLARVRIGERLYAPEEISARILGKIKAIAENALGRSVSDAVITVPAYFDNAQRHATKDAARLAGLNAVRIVNEPTAASLAYGIDPGRDGTVVVYDLGGGTFDVSILRIESGVFRVLSTHGDTHLGGDDFDRCIMERILSTIATATGAAVVDDPSVRQAIRRSAEEMKIALSNETRAVLDIEVGSHRNARIELSREQYETMIEGHVERTLRSCKSALADAELQPGAVDAVVLVGGSTRTPLVRRRLAELFGREPQASVDPDLAVALGAAVQADILSGGSKALLLLDVIPLSLGIETMGGAFAKLILRNSTIPCSAAEEFSTQVENQTGVDLNIFQGERELVKDCRKLGAFKLRGIPPMPAGLPRVRVTFMVDADGVLTVTAVEQRSGQTASIEVVPSHGLTEAEVDQILHDSLAHAEADILARENLELRNKARAMLSGTAKALEMAGDGCPPEQRFTIKRAMKMVSGLLEQGETKDLKRAVDALSAATGQIADDLIGAAVKRSLVGQEAPQPIPPERRGEG